MKSFLIAVGTLLSLAPGLATAQPSPKPAPTALSAACRAHGQAVDEAGLVRIGGIQQWVTIEGQDCANPVVLIVHGGPGNPNTPFAHNLFGSWAKDFTVVQWDQRGAGKTYEANPPAEDQALTIEQLTGDGVEVARYVTQRLGKRKVILMGGSWGSALAVHIAKARPDLFHAYVGTSQLVSYADDVKLSYARTLGLARAASDAETVDKLEKLGPPPWTNPRAFGTLRRATRKYEALKPIPRRRVGSSPRQDTTPLPMRRPTRPARTIPSCSSSAWPATAWVPGSTCASWEPGSTCRSISCKARRTSSRHPRSQGPISTA
jgi:pimeloyl-ACP methyl ester carboxylesterase